MHLTRTQRAKKGGIPLRTMKRFFQNLKLRNKIFAILWLSLIPLSLTAMIGLTGITHSYREILYHNIASQLSRSAETISDQIQSIEMMSYMLAAHERVQQDMPLLEPGGDFTERSVALRDLFSLLMEYHTRFDGNHISYVSLFSGETSTSGNMPVALQTSHRVHDDVREQARRAGGSPVWVSSYSGKYGLFLSREILPAEGYDERKLEGYLRSRGWREQRTEAWRAVRLPPARSNPTAPAGPGPRDRCAAWPLRCSGGNWNRKTSRCPAHSPGDC